MATIRPIYGPILLLIVLCIVQFSCNNADSNGDILNCFNETIDSVVRWNISIDEQEELDEFIDNATSTNDKDRCMYSVIPHWRVVYTGRDENNGNKIRNWWWIGYCWCS